MMLQDNKANLDLTGRCDDGSDVTYVSKHKEEQGVLMDIGKLLLIETMYLVVAL